MNNSILHISDLHFVTNAEQSKTRFDSTFQERFINAISDKNIKYLVVSGDIADKGKKNQYDIALKFLNTLVDILRLDKKNVLLCLGNHDIDWKELEKVIDEKDIEEEKLKEIHKSVEKYMNFKNFYHEFFGESKDFDCNEAIFDQIIDEVDRIVILGVNTCYRESNQEYDHIGHIEKKSFETKLSNIDLKSKYKDYGKFLVMHHNPKDLADERKHNLQNWKDLNKDNIGNPFVVLCGHIHGQDGERVISEEDNLINYISSSCLAKKIAANNTFNIYENIEADKMHIKYFALQDKESDKYYWQELTDKRAIKSINLRPTPDQENKKPDELNSLLFDSSISQQQDLEKRLLHSIDKKAYSIVQPATISLIDFIKENQLFKSGHFHWKNGFRSHGYIDINFLVSNKDSLELITKLFYEKIRSNIDTTLQNALIIAIGMECNIIGARLSAIFPNYDYSYIPEPSQHDDFEELEMRLEQEQFQNIILLKDIIFEAEHSKELIRKLKIVNKNIYLFSVFYCGERNKESDLFITDKEFENTKYYAISNEIGIEKCPYVGDGLQDCSIFNNKLQTIYEC